MIVCRAPCADACPSSYRVCFVLATVLVANAAHAATKTWDGQHSTEKIDVTVVYFVPADRKPLPDWRERVDYLCRRAELFHRREFGGQSLLEVKVHPVPFVSELTTSQLRSGDANAIFFRTMRETDARLQVSAGKDASFPVLLVLSEINWRPLDDFYRLKPDEGRLVFEGNYNAAEHFPGAASGGSRASYLADRRIGWPLNQRLARRWAASGWP